MEKEGGAGREVTGKGDGSVVVHDAEAGVMRDVGAGAGDRARSGHGKEDEACGDCDCRRNNTINCTLDVWGQTKDWVNRQPFWTSAPVRQR